VIQTLINHYNFKTAQDLYYLIEAGKIELLEIKDILQKGEVEEATAQTIVVQEKETKESTEIQYSDFLVIESRVEGLDYRLAKCCNPVFGDTIFGFVTISEGIKIHRTSCPNAHNMMARYPYRVVAARWRGEETLPYFIASVKITGIEEIGMVNRIADILSQYKIIIRSFNYKMDDGIFEGMLNIMVSNNNALQIVIKKIQSIKGVLKVIRVDSA